MLQRQAISIRKSNRPFLMYSITFTKKSLSPLKPRQTHPIPENEYKMLELSAFHATITIRANFRYIINPTFPSEKRPSTKSNPKKSRKANRGEATSLPSDLVRRKNHVQVVNRHIQTCFQNCYLNFSFSIKTPNFLGPP